MKSTTARRKKGPTPGTKRKLRVIIEILEGLYGRPKLRRRRDPLEELIVTLLSQNTNDLNRDRAYRSLRRRFPEWGMMEEADPADIADAIREGGLANVKSVRIKGILRWVRENFSGYTLKPLCSLPVEEAVEKLKGVKGVGPKTICCVLLFGCGKRVFPVDTHIQRVSSRLGLIPAKCTSEEAHRLLGRMVPEEEMYPFHLNMIRFGREVCRAPTPKCSICPLTRHCRYYKEEVIRKPPKESDLQPHP